MDPSVYEELGVDANYLQLLRAQVHSLTHTHVHTHAPAGASRGHIDTPKGFEHVDGRGSVASPSAPSPAHTISTVATVGGMQFIGNVPAVFFDTHTQSHPLSLTHAHSHTDSEEDVDPDDDACSVAVVQADEQVELDASPIKRSREERDREATPVRHADARIHTHTHTRAHTVGHTAAHTHAHPHVAAHEPGHIHAHAHARLVEAEEEELLDYGEAFDDAPALAIHGSSYGSWNRPDGSWNRPDGGWNHQQAGRLPGSEQDVGANCEREDRLDEAHAEIDDEPTTDLGRERRHCGDGETTDARRSLEHEEEVQTLVTACMDALEENNVIALHAAVRELGVPAVKALLARVLDIEARGGMLTADGARRRTPGGAFFFLLRTECGLTPDALKRIFAHDTREHNARRNARKKSREATDRMMRGLPL